MLDKYLQFYLLMRASIILSRLLEHLELQILIQFIPIMFGCNIGHQPPLIMWMLRLTRVGTLPTIMSSIKIGGLT